MGTNEIENIKSPKQTIRAYCIYCNGGKAKEIESCDADGKDPAFHACPFHPYRTGKKIMHSVKQVLSAFRITPSNVYQLQCQGKLPERPPRVITPDFIQALAVHIKNIRGSIPQDAQAILKEMSGEM